MKKKILTIAFLALGIVLICLSVILTVIACAQVDVIGGADLHTFSFVFFRQNEGVYSIVTLLGLILLIIGTALAVSRKKKQ